MKSTVKRTALSLLLACAPLAAGYAAEGDVPFKAALKASADPKLHDSLPEAVKKAGFIVAGTNPNTPPTTFYEADNKTLAGREIDVMSAIADRLGVAIHWKDTGGFDNIIPGLKSGRYDVALANIDANKKRFQQVDFVGYYNASKLALIARKDAALGPYTELAQLCGQTVSAGKPAITIPIFPDRPAGGQATISGRVPMFFGPYEGLRYQASHVKALALAGDINIEGTTVAIALPKGSELVKPVQAALNSLIADGSYQKILDGWDIGFGAVKTAGINEEIAK